ncbi:hypothetical protein C8J56DRAFT_1063958 [Mycena floridula]|nr:hypothetical protein C8J56DRAFT_1063958 [Mycena floridula]
MPRKAASQKQVESKSAFNDSNVQVWGSPGLIKALNPANKKEYLEHATYIVNLIAKNAVLGKPLNDKNNRLCDILHHLSEKRFANRLVIPDNWDLQQTRRWKLMVYVEKKYIQLSQRAEAQEGEQEEETDEEGIDELDENRDDEDNFEVSQKRVLRARKSKAPAVEAEQPPPAKKPKRASTHSARKVRVSVSYKSTSASDGASNAGPSNSHLSAPGGTFALLNRALANCRLPQYEKVLAMAGFNDTKFRGFSRNIGMAELAKALAPIRRPAG